MFAFYADESGTAKIHTPNTPWLIFLAVGFEDQNWKAIDDPIRALKRRFFPGWAEHTVEIHSNDIRRAAIQSYPPNPFSALTSPERIAFIEELYAIIDAAPLEWAAVAMHKPETIRLHGIASGPEMFKLIYALLLERLHGWCGRSGSLGRLFFDQLESNLLGGAHHDLVERDHFQLREHGTGWQRADNIVERPYFIDSCRSNHLQIADILAYNVYRRFHDNNPAYPFFLRTLRKVRGNMNPNTGRHYGLKVYPPSIEGAY